MGRVKIAFFLLITCQSYLYGMRITKKPVKNLYAGAYLQFEPPENQEIQEISGFGSGYFVTFSQERAYWDLELFANFSKTSSSKYFEISKRKLYGFQV